MATYTPTRPVDHLGEDRKPPLPPAGGGGDEGRGDGAPNYGARLRRARLGLICAIVTVGMVFVSLTSAYVVRRGLPTFDDSSRTYFRDWGEVQLPWVLLVINTGILLISSLTMEGARRAIARRAALAPVQSIPGVSLGEERHFPWLGLTVILGFGFLVGQWLAWGELRARGFLVSTNPDSSFIYLLTGGACSASGRGNYCVAVGGHHFPAAQAHRGTADCGRCCGLVLAFHGSAVDLCFCSLSICAITGKGKFGNG